jgi:alkanesulfonate monooxygenase SsuD/methylene tetrahydromethanopterin reductase-like flavin-dependent oxidoreductase (luciferase family)
VRVGLLYDLANPPEWRRDPVQLYQRAVEQAVWAEQVGLDAIWVTEHHFVDGYVSSPLPVVAAIAARTSRVRIGTSVLVAPLYHPVRLAEELAVIDLLSGGRVELGAGLGWALPEYECFGVDPRRRVSRMQEVLDVVRLAWTEETLSFSGRHFTFDGLQVLPKPAQDPHPPIWGGATSRAGGRRVGRSGLGLMWLERDVVEGYLEGWAEAGLPPDEARVDGYLNLLVCDDPEATWERVKPHFHYQRGRSSAAPRVGPGGSVAQLPAPSLDEVDAMRRAGSFLVSTPEEAVREIERRSSGLPVVGVFCHNTIPGMPDELSDRHVELLATVVAPALRARVSAS